MPNNNDKSFRHRVLIEALESPKRVPIAELPVPFPHRENGVTKQEEIFLRHWVVSYHNAAECARQAGYPKVTAAVAAWQLLAKPSIQQRLAEIEREMLASVSINAESLFREIVIKNLRLARATPPVQVWNPPCRYCYGTNHEYQRTHAEFETAFEEHITKPIRVNKVTGKPIRIPLFDPKGGSGYDPGLPPVPDCPECHGRGDIDNPVVTIKDSRFYTAEERELFGGAKRNKDGIEVFWKDQAQARNFLNDLALRMTEHRRPEDAIDITEMSTERIRQFLEYARDQGFDVDPEVLEDAG